MSGRSCPVCHGSGEVGVRNYRTGGYVRDENNVCETRVCPECDGSGQA
jgi:hypothetical protein